MRQGTNGHKTWNLSLNSRDDILADVSLGTLNNILGEMVHRNGSCSTVRGLCVSVHIVYNGQGATSAVHEALSAALAVFRISNDGFLVYLIETEYVHRTYLDATLASDAFI
jgi:hypothetical protein